MVSYGNWIDEHVRGRRLGVKAGVKNQGHFAKRVLQGRQKSGKLSNHKQTGQAQCA